MLFVTNAYNQTNFGSILWSFFVRISIVFIGQVGVSAEGKFQKFKVEAALDPAATEKAAFAW